MCDSSSATPFRLIEGYFYIRDPMQTRTLDPEIEDGYSHISQDGSTYSSDSLLEVDVDGDCDSVPTLPSSRPPSALEPTEHSVALERVFINDQSMYVAPVTVATGQPLLLTLRIITFGASILETIGRLYELNALDAQTKTTTTTTTHDG